MKHKGRRERRPITSVQQWHRLREEGKLHARPPVGFQRLPIPLALAVFLMVVLGPALALGGVHKLTIACATAASALMTLALVWGSHRRQELLIPNYGLLLLGVLTFTALQTIPLPLSVLSLVSGKSIEVLKVSLPGAGGLYGWYPLSLDPGSTTWELLKLGSCVAVFIGAYNLMVEPAWRDRLMSGLAFVGVVIVAVAVVGKYIAPDKHMLFYTPRATWDLGLIRTSFVNPNHGAAFLAISCVSALGLALSRYTTRWRVFYFVVASVVGTGVCLTLSRGGILALGGGLILFLFLEVLAGDKERRHAAAWIMLALLVVGFGGVFFGYEKLAEEFRQTVDGNLHTGKLRLWSSGLDMVLANPLVGVGRGAFLSTFPHYVRGSAELIETYSHMENQYLQLPAEWGIPVGLTLICSSIVGVYLWRRRGRQDVQSTAIFIALLVLAIQNLVDFSLEILAIALPAAALAGALSAGARKDRDEVTDGRRLGTPLSLGRPEDDDHEDNDNEDGDEDSSPWPLIRRLYERVRLSLLGSNNALVLLGLSTFLVVACGWAVTHFTDDPDKAIKEATASIGKEKQYASAMRGLTSAIRKRPADYYPHLVAAILTHEAKKKGTLVWLNRAMYLFPTSGKVHWVAARVFRRARNRTQALAEYRLAMRYTPGHPKNEVLREALSLCAKADDVVHLLSRTPDRLSTAIRELGKKGRRVVAADVAFLAMERWPDDEAIVRPGVAALIAAKRFDEASSSAKRFLAKKPGPVAIIAWAIAASANGQTMRKISILNGALKKYPKHDGIATELLATYLKQKDYDAAEKLANMRLDHASTFRDRARWHDRLAAIYKAGGKRHLEQLHRDKAQAIRSTGP
jgi:tetratricopeptide (TPR) repeat protein